MLSPGLTNWLSPWPGDLGSGPFYGRTRCYILHMMIIICDESYAMLSFYEYIECSFGALRSDIYC